MEDKNRVSCFYKYGDGRDGFQTRIVIWEQFKQRATQFIPVTLLQDPTSKSGFATHGFKLYMDGGESLRKRENWWNWKLREEALDYILWRTHFGRGYGPVPRQNMQWIDMSHRFQQHIP